MIEAGKKKKVLIDPLKLFETQFLRTTPYTLSGHAKTKADRGRVLVLKAETEDIQYKGYIPVKKEKPKEIAGRKYTLQTTEVPESIITTTTARYEPKELLRLVDEEGKEASRLTFRELSKGQGVFYIDKMQTAAGKEGMGLATFLIEKAIKKAKKQGGIRVRINADEIEPIGVNDDERRRLRKNVPISIKVATQHGLVPFKELVANHQKYGTELAAKSIFELWQARRRLKEVSADADFDELFSEYNKIREILDKGIHLAQERTKIGDGHLKEMSYKDYTKYLTQHEKILEEETTALIKSALERGDIKATPKTIGERNEKTIHIARDKLGFKIQEPPQYIVERKDVIIRNNIPYTGEYAVELKKVAHDQNVNRIVRPGDIVLQSPIVMLHKDLYK